jgi:sortase A
MKVVAKTLRRIEIALWFAGIALCGVALGATYDRWNYQVRQERALFQTTATREEPRRDAVTLYSGPIGPVAPVGPPAPAAAATKEKKSEAPPPPRIETPQLDPGTFGRIEIPRLGLKAIIREGADETTLARAVGLVPGAAQPGESGNIVLAGHRDTFFRPLRKIRVNDRIRVVVPPHEYEYRVDSLRIVAPEETSVLQSKGFEELTLVTCYPFRFVGPAPDRFIVSASRVN